MQEGNKKILYVDDDNGSLKIMSSNLFNNYDFELDTFDSPEKALQHIYNMDYDDRARWYDLIFIDVRMPAIPGDLLTKLVKETELKLITTPVIAVTAYLDDDLKQQLADVKITDIIEKPATIEKLQPIIWKYLMVLPKNPVKSTS
jgi:CheY-like chemotaxis protein